jgi:hypothetical protein
MANVFKYRVNLTGWSGAPGVNTFWASGPGDISAADINDFGTELGQMYFGLRDILAPSVSATLDTTVSEYAEATGALVAVHSATTWTNSALGTGTGNLSRAEMLKFQYVTDAIVGNRILRGGIYFGPINETAIDDNGAVLATVKTNVANAHDGLLDIVGPLRLGVWHQPRNGAGGSFGHVQGVGVAAVPGILRSRRD